MTLIPALLQADAAATTEAAEESRSLIEFIASGGEIGYVIIFLSMIAVGLVVAQFIRLRRNHLAPPEHVDALNRLLSAGDAAGAVRYAEEPSNDSFLTRIVGQGLSRCLRSQFGLLELRSAFEEAGQHEVGRLYRATESIGVVATVAPMLGLLGTTVGMVGAFDTLRVAEGVARPDQLAGDISVALITTVLGLIVAIPATAAYAFLRARVDSLASDVGVIVDALASKAESQSSRRQAAAPAPVAAPPRTAEARA